MISGLKSTIGSSISGKRCEVMEVVGISGLRVGLGNGGGVKVFIVDDLVATEFMVVEKVDGVGVLEVVKEVLVEGVEVATEVVVGVMVVENVDGGGVIEVVEGVLVEGVMIESGLQS